MFTSRKFSMVGLEMLTSNFHPVMVGAALCKSGRNKVTLQHSYRQRGAVARLPIKTRSDSRSGKS